MGALEEQAAMTAALVRRITALERAVSVAPPGIAANAADIAALAAVPVCVATTPVQSYPASTDTKVYDWTISSQVGGFVNEAGDEAILVPVAGYYSVSIIFNGGTPNPNSTTAFWISSSSSGGPIQAAYGNSSISQGVAGIMYCDAGDAVWAFVRGGSASVNEAAQIYIVKIA